MTVAGGSDDEFLNGEIFYTLTEAKVLFKKWRKKFT